VVGGSIPEISNGKLYNTSSVFDPTGKLIAKHRKVHLFDVSLKKVKMMESSVLTPGDSLTTFDTPFGKVGLIICYDVRFPEIFRLMLKKDIKAVVVPAAFSVVTGTAHWKMLMRTRAVDNQIYMIAASPARTYGKGYRAYGHSLVSDPFGIIEAEAGVGEEVIYADLNKERIEEVRNTLPLLRHRKF
jgi:predicted amidohydrolase